MSEKTLNVYGCGGLGINITRAAVAFKPEERKWARINPIFVDTSTANAALTEKNFYFIEPDADDELKGSGRVRKDNAVTINNNVKAILNKFPPSEYNVVVFSAHGGSGSVAGPGIVRELLRRGSPVVCVVQGGDEDALAARNVRATLATLDAIAREQVQKPVVMSYGHNEEGIPFNQLNQFIISRVLYLTRLFSGNIQGLDGRDIANWLDFSRPEVTGVTPQLSLLQFANSDQDAKEVDDPIAAIVIRHEKYDETFRSMKADFEKSGYATDTIENVTNQYFLISVRGCQLLMEAANRAHAEYEDKKQSRVSLKAISKDFSSTDETGMHF